MQTWPRKPYSVISTSSSIQHHLVLWQSHPNTNTLNRIIQNEQIQHSAMVSFQVQSRLGERDHIPFFSHLFMGSRIKMSLFWFQKRAYLHCNILQYGYVQKQAGGHEHYFGIEHQMLACWFTHLSNWIIHLCYYQLTAILTS